MSADVADPRLPSLSNWRAVVSPSGSRPIYLCLHRRVAHFAQRALRGVLGKGGCGSGGWNSKNNRLKVACLFPYTRQWPQALVKGVSVPYCRVFAANCGSIARKPTDAAAPCSRLLQISCRSSKRGALVRGTPDRSGCTHSGKFT